ncbi:MAG TPA: hypothetical protein VGQ76_24285 [Thermoanaerobaculia bacterium]|jgi:hypothetical protein|nr:hypothetical protein [Thermoanaerobaculia bacterium]
MPALFTDGDAEIIRHVTDYYLLTCEELAALTGRNPVSIRRRLQVLGFEKRKRGAWTTSGLQYLYRTCYERMGAELHYPTQKAFDFAFEQGWLSERVHGGKRDIAKLPHDRRVVQYRFHLRKLFGDRIHATQHFYNVYDKWGTKPDDHILADLFFYYRAEDGTFPSFFLEIENTAEHSYDAKGESARIRKAKSYVEYLERGLFQEKFEYPDVKFIFIVPSAKQARNFAKKLSAMGGAFNSKLFIIGDFQSVFGDSKKPYITPKDFEHARYSLTDFHLL